jgi:hypothetical protein
VAADQGPQADRDPLHHLDHAVLLPGRPLRAAHPPRAADPGLDMVEPDTYNRLFTMHGIIMVFFFLIPSIPATLGNFLLPLMIGAKDLAFPKINLASWYLYNIGGIFTLWAILAGGVDTGWTFYTPFSTTYSNSYVVLTIVGIFIAGFSSIFTGLNFIVTIHRMRAPGLTWFRLPLFVWAHYATSLIIVLGTPVVAITLLLVLVERLFGSASSTRRWAATRPLPAPLLVLLAPGGLHHDPAVDGRHQRAGRRLQPQAASSATTSSPSPRSPSRSSASWSGATTCSSPASRSTPGWSSRCCRCWWRSPRRSRCSTGRRRSTRARSRARRRCSTPSASSACSPSAG